MTDNNQEIQRQIKSRLDDFWALGPDTDTKASDGVVDTFFDACEDDIHWLLERVQNLETKLSTLNDEIMVQHPIFRDWGLDTIVICATCQTIWPCGTIRIMRAHKESE